MITNKPKYKIYVVAGPTASGKTAKAIDLAKEINGELINADSRQIYKYLDIGTNKGKLTPKGEDFLGLPKFEIEDSGVDIHLVSFIDPDQQFTAYAYRDLVFKLIPEIVSRGKIPILVGGTGLYIDLVINAHKYAESEPNEQLKEELNQLTLTQLQEKLNELSPETLAGMNNSDLNNPRRIISAILRLRSQSSTVSLPFNLEVEVILTILNIEIITERVNKRVEEMFEAGIVTETKKVLERGFPHNSIALQGIGYREILQLLDGKINGAECIKLIQISHRQYAKRQITWFKKYLN